MNMVSTIEIKKLGDVEKGELNNLIPQFEYAFVSDNQRFVRADFDKIPAMRRAVPGPPYSGILGIRVFATSDILAIPMPRKSKCSP